MGTEPTSSTSQAEDRFLGKDPDVVFLADPMLRPNSLPRDRSTGEAEWEMIVLFEGALAAVVQAVEQRYGPEGFAVAEEALAGHMIGEGAEEFEQLPDRDVRTYVGRLLSGQTIQQHYEIVESTTASVPLADPTLRPASLSRDRSTGEAEWAMIALFGGALAAVVQAVEQRYGPEGFAVAEDALIGHMVGGGAVEFEQLPDRSDVRTYVRWLLSGLTIQQHYEIVESTPDSVRLKFTNCPLAGFFRSIGKPEVGAFFCHVDRPMTRAFNGDFDFEITKTLMQGDDHCNHHFFRRREETEASQTEESSTQ